MKQRRNWLFRLSGEMFDKEGRLAVQFRALQARTRSGPQWGGGKVIFDFNEFFSGSVASDSQEADYLICNTFGSLSRLRHYMIG